MQGTARGTAQETVRRTEQGTLQAKSMAAAAVAVAAAFAGCGGAAAMGKPPARSCPSGAVLLASQDDIEALRGCARVGGLTLRSGAELSLEPLAQLVAVDGDLVVGPSLRLDALSLPALREVTGRLRISGNSSLGGAYLPALARAGRVEIEHNASLATLSLPALTVAAALIVREDAALEALSLQSLAKTDELVLSELPKLGWIDAPQLAPVARGEIGALPAMEPAALDELRARTAAAAP